MDVSGTCFLFFLSRFSAHGRYSFTGTSQRVVLSALVSFLELLEKLFSTARASPGDDSRISGESALPNKSVVAGSDSSSLFDVLLRDSQCAAVPGEPLFLLFPLVLRLLIFFLLVVLRLFSLSSFEFGVCLQTSRKHEVLLLQ